jgi:hypothetical protein
MHRSLRGIGDAGGGRGTGRDDLPRVLERPGLLGYTPRPREGRTRQIHARKLIYKVWAAGVGGAGSGVRRGGQACTANVAELVDALDLGSSG